MQMPLAIFYGDRCNDELAEIKTEEAEHNNFMLSCFGCKHSKVVADGGSVKTTRE
jgi:hypothetical protein